jgi:uncharacterized protein (DUF736 family)
MTMAFDNRNTGALFKNDRKDGDNAPDYRGTINVAGAEFWLSAWVKTSKKGVKFMSLSLKPKEERPAAKATGGVAFDMDDEIPFSPEWRG